MKAPARHGTRSKYTAGCRCDDCRQANTQRITAWNRRRNQEFKNLRQAVEEIRDSAVTITDVWDILDARGLTTEERAQ